MQINQKKPKQNILSILKTDAITQIYKATTNEGKINSTSCDFALSIILITSILLFIQLAIPATIRTSTICRSHSSILTET